MSEEEAIEICKKIMRTYDIKSPNIYIREKEEIKYSAIETVLNMIEDKKQKIRRLCRESNQLFNENEKLKEKLEESTSNEYECNHRIIDLLDEIEKRDKVIDLMAKAFKQDDVRSVDEIIEYFKEQVENEEKGN